MCHRQKRCSHVVQLRAVTISSIYIYIYIPTLLPYSTCPGDCLTRMIFFGCFPIPSLLSNSTIIAYLKTRQTAFFHIISNKLNSVALVRTRTIPTERPPSVGEISANFYGYKRVTWSAQRVPTAVNLCFLDLEPLLFSLYIPLCVLNE